MTERAAAVLPDTDIEAPAQRPRFESVADRSLLAFSDVWRHWGRGKNRWAVLQGIDLQLAPGTATSITGRNGVGKTTLLRIATGILAADRGTVTLDGYTTSSWREYHRRLGFLSAGDRGLYARVSVRAHLEYWARLAFVAPDQRAAAVSTALERFALTELASRRADRLSQGQRQRLRLALALVHDPAVLLLDEPRISLDADGLALLGAAVDGVVARGGTVLWCGPAGEDQGYAFTSQLVIEDGRLSPA